MINMQISTPNAQLWHLLNMLQSIVRVPPHLIATFNGLSDVSINDQVPVTSVRKFKYIICSEICSKDEVTFISVPVFQYINHAKHFVACDFCYKPQNELTHKLKRCTRCFAVSYCSRECQSRHWQSHAKVCTKELKMSIGIPFFITLNKDGLNYKNLEDSLRELAKNSIENVRTTGETSRNNESTSDIENSDIVLNCSFLIKSSAKMNLNDESCVTITQENLSFDMTTKSACLIIEWQTTPPDDEKSNNDIRSRLTPAYQVPAQQVYSNQSSSDDDEAQCTLNDCLKLFMEPERLDQKGIMVRYLSFTIIVGWILRPLLRGRCCFHL